MVPAGRRDRIETSRVAWAIPSDGEMCDCIRRPASEMLDYAQIRKQPLVSDVSVPELMSI